ncbi:MAG: major capsid protein [Aeromonadaceae bacterium]
MGMKTAIEQGKFELSHLTLAINKTKTTKTRLAELGIFEEDGITTLTADIEYLDGKLILVTEKERGEQGDSLEKENRDIHTFRAVHLPMYGKLKADDLQDKREFGKEYSNGEGGEQVDKEIAKLHKRQKQSLELTLEMLRFGAMRGIVYGASGKVIVNLFEKFGISPTANVDTIDFTNEKTVRSQLAKVKRESKKHQDGVKATRYRALCSATFMDALLECEGFAKAYTRFQDSAAFRNDVRSGIEWDGVIWEEHTETKPNGELFVPEGEALFFPENCEGLFVTRFAPADYNETVNTVGLPFYSIAEPMKMNKGMEMEAQSNPINVCTSPLAVRVLKMAEIAGRTIEGDFDEVDEGMSPEAEAARQAAIEATEAKKVKAKA